MTRTRTGQVGARQPAFPNCRAAALHSYATLRLGQSPRRQDYVTTELSGLAAPGGRLEATGGPRREGKYALGLPWGPLHSITLGHSIEAVRIFGSWAIGRMCGKRSPRRGHHRRTATAPFFLGSCLHRCRELLVWATARRKLGAAVGSCWPARLPRKGSSSCQGARAQLAAHPDAHPRPPQPPPPPPPSNGLHGRQHSRRTAPLSAPPIARPALPSAQRVPGAARCVEPCPQTHAQSEERGQPAPARISTPLSRCSVPGAAPSLLSAHPPRPGPAAIAKAAGGQSRNRRATREGFAAILLVPDKHGTPHGIRSAALQFSRHRGRPFRLFSCTVPCFWPGLPGASLRAEDQGDLMHSIRHVTPRPEAQHEQTPEKTSTSVLDGQAILAMCVWARCVEGPLRLPRP
ncbi:hypothetical protein DFH27DRAFT_527040 [Peziza echinospora]|nr:hypothetical protein DFH27DRAFT_527040 [Peziza echinospora]